jgi:ribosomal protein S18 acetylase RimI-like enzyme
MNIRLLDKKDWPQFQALRLEALFTHPEAFGSSYEEEVILSGDAFEKGFNKSTIFGAFQEKQLVGCVGFFIHSPSKMTHRGVVFSMYTKPEFRSFGIGDALLKAVIAHAKKVVIQLHLTVVTTNQSALRLYEKNGFSIYGTEPRSLKIGDHFYDEHMMVLEF